MTRAKITTRLLEEEPKPTSAKYLRLRNLELVHWMTIFLILALLGAFTALGLYFRSAKQLAEARKELAMYKSNPSAQAQEEVKQIVEKVSQLVVLPSDETPTVATVTDLEKLKNQPFFAQAQIGDKVLIFAGAKKAILYRLSTNKVIEIAPFNTGQPTEEQTNAPTAASVIVLNGSGVSGQGKRVGDMLKSQGFSVSRVGDASVTAVTKIQYKDGYEDDASVVNQKLGGSATLQADNSIEASILVTIGNNYIQ